MVHERAQPHASDCGRAARLHGPGAGRLPLPVPGRAVKRGRPAPGSQPTGWRGSAWASRKNCSPRGELAETDLQNRSGRSGAVFASGANDCIALRGRMPASQMAVRCQEMVRGGAVTAYQSLSAPSSAALTVTPQPRASSPTRGRATTSAPSSGRALCWRQTTATTPPATS